MSNRKTPILAGDEIGDLLGAQARVCLDVVEKAAGKKLCIVVIVSDAEGSRHASNCEAEVEEILLDHLAGLHPVTRQ